eukprot:Awhi_evm1s13988
MLNSYFDDFSPFSNNNNNNDAATQYQNNETKFAQYCDKQNRQFQLLNKQMELNFLNLASIGRGDGELPLINSSMDDFDSLNHQLSFDDSISGNSSFDTDTAFDIESMLSEPSVPIENMHYMQPYSTLSPITPPTSLSSPPVSKKFTSNASPPLSTSGFLPATSTKNFTSSSLSPPPSSSGVFSAPPLPIARTSSLPTFSASPFPPMATTFDSVFVKQENNANIFNCDQSGSNFDNANSSNHNSKDRQLTNGNSKSVPYHASPSRTKSPYKLKSYGSAPLTCISSVSSIRSSSTPIKKKTIVSSLDKNCKEEIAFFHKRIDFKQIKTPSAKLGLISRVHSLKNEIGNGSDKCISMTFADSIMHAPSALNNGQCNKITTKTPTSPSSLSDKENDIDYDNDCRGIKIFRKGIEEMKVYNAETNSSSSATKTSKKINVSNPKKNNANVNTATNITTPSTPINKKKPVAKRKYVKKGISKSLSTPISTEYYPGNSTLNSSADSLVPSYFPLSPQSPVGCADSEQSKVKEPSIPILLSQVLPASPPCSPISQSGTSSSESKTQCLSDRKCINCGATRTPLWRKNEEDENTFYCNACGLYRNTYKKNRPINLRQRHVSHVPADISCVNCQTSASTAWRKDSEGRQLCNPCGLYAKLHGKSRPPNLFAGSANRVRRRKGKTPKTESADSTPKIRKEPKSKAIPKAKKITRVPAKAKIKKSSVVAAAIQNNSADDLNHTIGEDPVLCQKLQFPPQPLLQ